jgi:N-acetylglucosaminyl-diphospho-decaprenol L-rhamnosyltransferase
VDLSIIIVNWNSVKYLKSCLESIKNLEPITYEIIIVDNASYDGCAEFIEKEYAGAIFVQSGKNLGFAKANNLGALHSSGRNLLFLNPDTEIIDDAIQGMQSSLEALSDAGAIGCKLLNSDFSIQTSCIQPIPTVLNQLIDIEYLKMKTKKLKLWGIRPMFSVNRKPEEVQVISGACVMVKRDVFNEIGCFSEDYFMYSEDIDLCYKIKKAGYKNYYTSEACVIHHGGGSSKSHDQTHFGAALMREAVYIFLKKTKGRATAQTYRAAMMLSSIIRVIILRAMILILMRDELKISLNKWKRIFRWAIGMENKKIELISNQS